MKDAHSLLAVCHGGTLQLVRLLHHVHGAVGHVAHHRVMELLLRSKVGVDGAHHLELGFLAHLRLLLALAVSHLSTPPCCRRFTSARTMTHTCV
jgi:hypothetical protein